MERFAPVRKRIRGQYEEALIGAPVPDPKNPLNVVRIIPLRRPDASRVRSTLSTRKRMKSENSLSNSDANETEVVSPNPPLVKGGRGDMLLHNSQSPSDELSHGGEDISPQKTVILGVGNVLLSDEGIGVHVANELSTMELPPGVSVIEGGTDGFRLLNIITEADRLIVVDAVKGGAGPGSIYRFNVDEVKECAARVQDIRPSGRHT